MDSSKPTRLICALTSPDVDSMRRDMAKAAELGADAVECRLDFLKPPPTDDDLVKLLDSPPLEAIVTYRPQSHGGLFVGSEEIRLATLRRAAQLGARFVDVEQGTLRENWPSAPVIHSYHNFRRCPDHPVKLAQDLAGGGPAAVKIAYTVTNPDEALLALDVLRASTTPAIALGMGEAGVLSRVLARKFGAFGTFAALWPGCQSAPGQPTLEEFKSLYRWNSIGPSTQVFGVIGSPIAHSMSPAIHNAAFAAAGLDAVYLPLRIDPGADNFDRFMDALLDRPWLDWRGLSVTIPHKENALAYVGAENCDELSARIGAINTVTIGPDGALRGDNTDYAAALDALCAAMRIPRQQLAGRTVAVLGAGGAARAIVAALAYYQAQVTIYNRTVARGEKLAEEFGCQARSLETVLYDDNEIIVNCTPIGMHPFTADTPLKHIPSSAKVVFDTIYNPARTTLLCQAQQGRCLTVSGLEMFVNQAVAQFETWTGLAAPRDTMAKVVDEKLSPTAHNGGGYGTRP